MIRFRCGSCGKRFVTTDDPAPGRAYRIRCACGNVNVVQADAGAEREPPPLPPPTNQSTPTQPVRLADAATDDPFVRAMMKDAPWQDPAPPAEAVPAITLSVARRDPVYAERYDAPEFSEAYDAQFAETTRETRLAGPRALLLDVTARLREILGAGLRQLLPRRRSIAGGAVLGVFAFGLGFFAFGLGLWVGAGSKAAAEAEARSGTADASPRTVAAAEASPRSVAAGTVVPAVALVPVAALAAVAVAERHVPPSGPWGSRAATRRRIQGAEPGAVRPAETESAGRKAMVRAAEEPTPAREPTPAQELARDEKPVRTADRTHAAGVTAMAASSDGHDAQGSSQPTLTASPELAATAAATTPEPTPAEPTDSLPEK